MATVIRQPGLRSQTSGTSGSVQYLGGYDGPYAGEEDVFLQEKKARPNEVPIPMGLEVFQGVSKLVAHQVVGEDEVRLREIEDNGYAKSRVLEGQMPPSTMQIKEVLHKFKHETKFFFGDAVLSWWSNMEFIVDDGAGNQLFNVKEIKTLNSFVQALLGQWRSFYLKVINSSVGNWIMELEHPASCSCPVFCPWAGPAMTVRMPTGEVLGHIKHAGRETCGSWLGPSYYFEVYNYEGNLVYKVEGPAWYPWECTRDSVAVFKILKEGSQSEPAQEVGEITHTWRGCCGGICSCCISGEPDFVTISFPESLSAEDKALFLGLLFAVMHAYLEVQ